MKACAIILILVVHIHADSVEGPTAFIPAVAARVTNEQCQKEFESSS